jgi:nitrogen-specific signal transduction histidine kinase
VILLTARGDLQSKVRGLEAGAEDYITKPFHPDEVLARVRSLLTIGDLRRKLVHAERLAAIAQMAVTVKHEVNNPLSVIQGNVELLEVTLADAGPAVHAKLRGIVEQVGRIQQALSRLDSLRRADPTTYQGGTLMISLDDGGEERDP